MAKQIFIDEPSGILPTLRGEPACRWSHAMFDELGGQGDPLADRIVAEILDHGEVESVNALLRALTHNATKPPDELSPRLREYFEATSVLPEWADPELIMTGQRLFVRYGLPLLQSLLWRSLPECYAAADGAAVLASTGRLELMTRRRVLETLQFCLDVMAPGGLGPQGRGIRSAQRVRLLHAAVRAHLLDGGGTRWDPALGVPISQEDLLATLGSFSVLPVDSLARLGIELSTDEQRAYLHCWNVVGAVLGVREDLLFHDVDDGLVMWRYARARHHRRSTAGVALTRALLAFVDELIPGEWLDGISPTMVRFLAGDAVADILDVPAADWTRGAIGPYSRLLSLFGDFQGLGSAAARVGERLGAAMIRSLLGYARVGARPNFDIPTSLRERWDIQDG